MPNETEVTEIRQRIVFTKDGEERTFELKNGRQWAIAYIISLLTKLIKDKQDKMDEDVFNAITENFSTALWLLDVDDEEGQEAMAFLEQFDGEAEMLNSFILTKTSVHEVIERQSPQPR